MNINPKDKRNYHHLSVEQKKVLFTTIHKVIGQFDISYSRMFTEPRAQGYRTKLWYGGKDISIKLISTVADRIYSELKQTSMESMISSVVGYSSVNYHKNDPAFLIKFN